MKKKYLNYITIIAFIFAMAMILSSCHKGYGCPYDF